MATFIARAPLVLLCLLAGCPSTTRQGPDGAIVVTVADSTLDAIEATTQMNAVVLNRRSQPIESEGVTWSSSDTAVATVDAAGLVTAQGNGRVVITARDARNRSGAYVIVVQQIPVALEISPDDWPTDAAWIGARRQFTADVLDANGHPISGAPVIWTSSDDSVVDVNNTGLATAMNDGANVVVTAMSGAFADSLNVTVNADGSNGPGTMYTIWFPRNDDAPAILANGKIYVPDDVVASVSRTNPTPPWPHSRPTVHKFQWDGDRIGILTDMADGSGTFRVRDRIGEWVNLVIANAVDFQLEGNRIAVLQRDGSFLVKDGIHGPWTVLASDGAAGFQLEGDLIALLLDDGELRVRDGINGPWTVQVEAGDSPRFQLEVNRIGVLLADGTLRVRQGTGGQWVELGNDVASFKIRGNRFAVLQEDNVFRVQDGLSGTPVTLSDEPLAQYEMENHHIAVRFASGLFRVKFDINGAWTELAAGDVREFQMQATWIGYIRDSDGSLLIRDGIDGDWVVRDVESSSANVTQFRLVVDVPSPPYHTTPATYATEQARCAGIGEDAEDDVNDCYTVPNFAIPVAFYGMFCGGGRPHVFGDAIVAGAIDSFDQLCWHHDMVESWYPETPNDGSDDAGACIVRYGLRHGRLTSNGVVLTHGYESAEDWEAGWEGRGMVNLKDALDDYFTYTVVCDENELALFTSLTSTHR